MTQFRCWTNRSFAYVVGSVLAAFLSIGAPNDARAQTRFDFVAPAEPAVAAQTAAGQTQGVARTKNWRKKHPVAFATLIGTAAGAAVGCGLGAAAPNSDEVSCAYLAAPFGLLGAAIGVVPGMVTERRNQREPLSFDEVQRRVKAGTTVIVVGQGGQQTAGKVVAVAADSLTMRSKDGATISLPSQTSTWHLTSDSLTNGMLIGAGIGAVAAVVNYKDGASAAGAISGVGIWALIGTLVDRGFNHQKLIVDGQPGRRSASLTVSPWLGPHSGGLAFSAAF
jgi:hypothetical protein